jgi:tetratricopeptide (TPR) repeat protein
MMNKWKGVKGVLIAAIAAVGIFVLTPAHAQEGASVHGHVINPAGQPLEVGDVKLSHDHSSDLKTMKFTNSFPIGKDGSYTGSGIAPGDYFGYVIADNKIVDFQQVTLKGGDDKTLDFDMTRAEYVKGMTPAEKKALEEFKAKNAAAVSENKQIANLNGTLKAVREDLAKNAAPTYGDVSKDVTDMKSAVDAKPDESILWYTYAQALEAQGEHLANADRQAHKPVTGDDEAMKDYGQAIDGFKKSADLNAASKKPNIPEQAAAWNSAGNTLAKEGKSEDAAAAFENAVKLEPQNAGMFYGNEAAVLFNANQLDAAAAAADKAIAADPTKPTPYFIKGQALIAKSTFDAKTKKIVPPPGCVDAYQKFLELEPDGPRSAQVKEVLASLGEKVQTTYRAGRKH